MTVQWVDWDSGATGAHGSRVKNQDLGGFQVNRRAWDPRRPDIVELLSTAPEAAIQPIYYGSNHTFLVTLDAGAEGRSFAVYKPARGEYPLSDFETGSLYRREVGTWLVDSVLGWNLVPPTVVHEGRHGVGSLQIFVESKSEGEIAVDDLRRLTLLDVITNNADRKGEHLLLGRDGTLWGIDHGLTFNAQPKLRTVLWHFAGDEIPDDMRGDLIRLHGALTRCDTPAVKLLAELISRHELLALRLRSQRLLAENRFPDPKYKGVPYRW